MENLINAQMAYNTIKINHGIRKAKKFYNLMITYNNGEIKDLSSYYNLTVINIKLNEALKK